VVAAVPSARIDKSSLERYANPTSTKLWGGPRPARGSQPRFSMTPISANWY